MAKTIFYNHMFSLNNKRSESAGSAVLTQAPGAGVFFSWGCAAGTLLDNANLYFATLF